MSSNILECADCDSRPQVHYVTLAMTNLYCIGTLPNDNKYWEKMKFSNRISLAWQHELLLVGLPIDTNDVTKQDTMLLWERHCDNLVFKKRIRWCKHMKNVECYVNKRNKICLQSTSKFNANYVVNKPIINFWANCCSTSQK